LKKVIGLGDGIIIVIKPMVIMVNVVIIVGLLKFNVPLEEHIKKIA